MAFRVFELDSATIQALESDDVVARQTLVVRDGSPWGAKGKVMLVQGAEDAVRRAEEIVAKGGGRVFPRGDEVKSAIDAEAEDAAGGVGFIFG